MSSLFLFALLLIYRVPPCQWGLGDGTYLPSPCRYILKSGEFLIIRRPLGPVEYR